MSSITRAFLTPLAAVVLIVLLLSGDDSDDGYRVRAIFDNGGYLVKDEEVRIAGATVGTDNVKVGSASYAARHVKFGAGNGNMEWWLADSAPGTVVKVQFSGQDKDEKWIMQMVGNGSGAKSELGVK